MRPLVLLMNILVAGIGTFLFARNGFCSARILVPLLLGSMPMAHWAGGLEVDSNTYKTLVGIVLLIAALQTWRKGGSLGAQELALATIQPVFIPWMVLIGAGIGLIAGLTGTGGGIFLSPLLLALGWATPKHVSGIAAPFVALNSLAALIGYPGDVFAIAYKHALWVGAAAAGGCAGAIYGVHYARNKIICRLLAIVLLVAAIKLCSAWFIA